MDNNSMIIAAVIVVLAIIVFVVYKKRNGSGSTNKIISAVNVAGIAGIQETLNRQLSFTSDVVAYFKGLKLNPQKDTPFIIDGNVLGKQIKGVPKTGSSIFIGVYNEGSNTITNPKFLVADSFDTQTKEILNKAQDGIVALS